MFSEETVDVVYKGKKYILKMEEFEKKGLSEEASQLLHLFASRIDIHKRLGRRTTISLYSSYELEEGVRLGILQPE